MPRVHFVKKARKNYGDIKKGESYYWWKFRYCAKSRSKTAPKPSQLTRSEFWGTIYDIQEELSGVEDRDQLDEIVSRIRELADEQDEKKNNMPDSLQEGPIGELLTSREDSCNDWVDELDALDIEDEDFNFDDIPEYSGE